MKAAARLLLILALIAPNLGLAQAATVAPAPTCRLFTSATIVNYNTRVRLDWSSQNTASGYLTDVGAISASGFAFVVPGKNTTYAASFTGPGGTIVCRVGIAVKSGTISSGSGASYSAGVVNINGGSSFQATSLTATGNPIDTAPVGTDINTGQPVNTTGNPIDTAPIGTGINTNQPIDTNHPVNLNGTVNLGGNVTFPTAPVTSNATAQTQTSGGLLGGLVPSECRGKSTVVSCDLCSLAQLGQNVANFLLGLTIPAAALLFAWAGILFFSSRGVPEQINRAKKIFMSVVIGFVIAVGAWVLVNTVMNMLVQGADFKGWSWKSLSCAQTRAARLYDMSLSQYLNSSLPALQSYSGGGSGATLSQEQQALYTAQCAAGDAASCGILSLGTVNGSDSSSRGLGGSNSGFGASSGGGGTFNLTSAQEDQYTSECAAGNTVSCGILDQVGQPTSGAGGVCPSGSVYSDGGGGAGSCYNPTNDTVSDPILASPSQTAVGDCSTQSLSGAWGGAAAGMSCITAKESSCNSGLASGVDRGADGNAFSFGLYQINVNANYMQCDGFNGGQKVNCPSAFSGKNFNGRVVDQDLYTQCAAMAKNVDCATQNAQRLYNQSGFKPWSTAKSCGL